MHLPCHIFVLFIYLLQVNVPFTDDTNIQCMQNTNSEIDYFVSVGSTTRIEDMLENHPVSIHFFLHQDQYISLLFFDDF